MMFKPRPFLILLSFLIGIVLFLMTFAVILTVSAAEPVQVLENTWALGIDESTGCPGDIDSAWAHSENVSLSRCPKNPAPPGQTDGAAFKNGPVNGFGQVGVETWSAQTFTLPVAESYTFDFSTLIICVRCDYVRADLYADGNYVGDLLDFPNISSVCDTSEKWPRFCGNRLTVPYASEYTLLITSMFSQSDSLGAKWTGLELWAEASGAVFPTPTPVPPTPTPLPELFFPLMFGQVGHVVSDGCVLGVVSVSDHEIVVDCK